MTGMNWLWALIVVAAGIALGDLAGRLVRASLNRPERSPEVREASRRIAAGMFWGLSSLGVLVAVAGFSRETLTEVVDRASANLPAFLIGAVIVLVGYGLGVLLATMIGQSVARATGVRHGGVERLIRAVVVVAALTLALGQLGVSEGILITVLVAAVVPPAVGAAILTGLGARDVARQVAAGRSLRGRIQPGRTVHLLGVEGFEVAGVIRAVHAVTFTVETADGELVDVPHALLLERPFRLE